MAGSWNAAPSLKPYLSFSYYYYSCIHVLHVDLSISSVAPLLSPLRFGLLTRREFLPLSLSAYLLSRSLFLLFSSFVVLPSNLLRCLSRYVASSFFVSSSFGLFPHPPSPLSSLLSRSLSLASCLSSTMRFLSSSRIAASLFSRPFSPSPVLSARGSHFVYD